MARSRAQGPRRRGRDRRRRARAVRRRAGRAARARTDRGPRERRADERAAPQLPRGRCRRSIGRGRRPARGGGAPIELVSHPAFARLHPTGHHPESPRRLDVLQGAFPDWVAARPASEADVERCHAPEYLALLRSVTRPTWLDGDTPASETGWEAALLSAGAALQ